MSTRSSSPVRVLHVGHGRVFGGIEAMLVTLARFRHLCDGMVPGFAFCFDGRVADEVRDAGATLRHLGEVRVSRPLTVRRARRALRSVLEAGAYDVVICHAAWPHALFGPVAAAAEIPVVFWQHGELSGRHWTERWAGRCRPALAICNSRFTAQSLARVFPDVLHEVMSYPVAPPTSSGGVGVRSSICAELDTPENATVIVQVSRMEPWKGHRTLLAALGGLRDRADWVCWIVGGAQRPAELAYERELRDSVLALGIEERVRFCGQRADVSRLLQAADIFCQPNAGPEPFGIVFVEALYAGLPVAATAIGGALEIVDPGCGILVQPEDASALSEALTHLLADKSLRDRLGAAGPARARALCDPQTQLQRLAALCAAIAQRR